MERLQKFLARSGVASRRKAESLISAGRVQVNGLVVTKLGVSVDPDVDRIDVDGIATRPIVERTYLMVNKPPGVLSAASDPRGRRTVVDLVPTHSRLFPVGRLDLDSEGLLLLTDDGNFAMLLTHPRHRIEKEYAVLVRGSLGPNELQLLRDGVDLDDRMTAPAQVDVTTQGADRTWLRIVLHEGRNRQIRRMVEKFGGEVQRLIRVRVGPLRLDRLTPGKWRRLANEEVDALRAAAS